MAALTQRVEQWRADGRLVELGGRRIFVRSAGGEGPTLVFLHGYPSSSYDWRAVLGELGERSTLSFDFLGFGLSDKPRDHVYSLNNQADLVEEIAAAELGGEPVVLVAHDMGTSVATELLARDIEGRLGLDLAAVLLFNGSMVIERASLTLSQKVLRSPLGPLMARLSSERFFRAQFARLFSAAHPLGDDEVADQWSLIAHAGGNRILDKLTFYLGERTRYAERWHGALRDWPGRLELAWGIHDPVATTAVLDAVLDLRPQAPVERWSELGHYPQLEDPGLVARTITRVAAGPEVASP